MRHLLASLLLALPSCSSTPTVRVEFPSEPPGSLERVMMKLMEGAPPARGLGVSLVVADEDDDMLGYTVRVGPQHWFIQIDASLDYQLQVLVLSHEWAHVLVGDGGCGLEGAHGPTFGVAWAAAWRALHGEDS